MLVPILSFTWQRILNNSSLVYSFRERSIAPSCTAFFLGGALRPKSATSSLLATRKLGHQDHVVAQIRRGSLDESKARIAMASSRKKGPASRSSRWLVVAHGRTIHLVLVTTLSNVIW